MEKYADPIPAGYHSVTPTLVLRNAPGALKYYQKAFGAERLLLVVDRPDGKIMHAAIKIGDSVVMLAEECVPHDGHESCVWSPEDLKGTTVNLYMYVNDADSLFRQAIQAGAKSMMPVEEMLWGDRMGMVRDPYGHIWSLATHIHDLTPEEMTKRAQGSFAYQI